MLPETEKKAARENATERTARILSLIHILNAVMVEGIEVLSFRQIAEEKKMTGMAIVAAADYLLDLVPGILPDDWETQVDAFLAQSEIRILKQTKRSEKEVDIKPLIYRMEVQDHKLFMQLAAGSVETVSYTHLL